ncbi:class IV adenylate cyclase [Bacillus sp. DX4.1]|uniref:class IV adenylate cyclase n=1 Tax=Bacillus sp. DX4.1 TaxID=3055867 RepID=UPI0025A025A0|nr:class IV adenylate cyclase [Bacillus sp. DX4.1]MDM5185979.1 class IV adenylate cyclase [Bacillus sp. DX4.1]
MKEIELRFKIDDANEILDKLENSEFEFLLETFQKDEYFKHKGLEKEEEKKGAYIYRMRHDSVKGISAVKKLTFEPGVWEEFEVNVEGKNAEFIQMLLKDSMSSILTIDKSRKSFQKDDFSINVDVIKGLGEFIEVELLAEDNTEKEIKRIEALMISLGIDKSKIIKDGYVTLVKKEKGLL